MTTWEIIAAAGLAVVLAWLFWPRRAKRGEHGYMPKTWQSRHSQILDDELHRDRQRRAGRQ